MKSIEERAKAYACKTISDNTDGKLNAILIEEPYKKEGYIQGATEQKEIDVAEINLNTMITFTCINKDVSMSVQQLIDYYVDTECVKVAEECNF